MKINRFYWILLAGLFVLSACGKKKDKQILDLQLENEQIQAEFHQKDSVMNELFSAINAIEKNLSDIALREKSITATSSQEMRGNADVRDRIMQDIILINNILEENRKRIGQLNDQLKRSNLNVASLQENINMLTLRLQEREEEVSILKDQLAKLNFDMRLLNATIDTLREESAFKSRVINQQDELIGEMNTIWYVTGTKKALTDLGIIDKAGGFLSGRMRMSSRINLDHFTAGDIRELRLISFDAKNVEFVTVHPEGTFQLMESENGIKGLEILQPDEFWKSSRFLVMITR